MEALKFSLSSVALAETADTASFAAPLIQIQYINGLSSAEFDTRRLMALEYSSNILASSDQTRKLADSWVMAEDVLRTSEPERNIVLRFIDNILYFLKTLPRKIVNKLGKRQAREEIYPGIIEEIAIYENKGDFQTAITLYRQTIKRFPDRRQTPLVMLRLGYLYHRIDRQKEAEEIYQKIIKDYPFSNNTASARLLLSKLKKAMQLRQQANRVMGIAKRSLDVYEQQKYLYEAAQLQFNALDLYSAKDNYNKVIELVPDTDIAQKAYIRLGICQKLLGEVDDSIKTLQNLLTITTSSELRSQALQSLSQIYRQKGDYKSAVGYILKAFEATESNKVKALLLFQLGSIYQFDLKDKKKAKEIFSRLKLEFPDDILAYLRKELLGYFVESEVLKKEEEVPKEPVGDPLVKKLLPKNLLKIIENGAVRLTTYITEGVKEIVMLEEYDVAKGDFVTIDLSEKRLNNYMKKWFPPGNKTRIWKVSTEFGGDRKLKVTGTIHLSRGYKIKGFMEGQFKLVHMRERPYWLRGISRRYYLIYIADSCKIGKVPVPNAIVHIFLNPCVLNFNKDFPLEIEQFALDTNKILFAGPIREDMKAEILSEAFGSRHMEEKGEQSGFIYGRRKESLGASESLKTKPTPTRDRDLGGLSF
ncbi:MAG: tetratricopeptide repeat protein [Candidatus Omnitrophica bacterium]|nr:tetratricopeptide repeat protein [Candidatus Omnitrophota bacterium]